jgi:hypothetical protein
MVVPRGGFVIRFTMEIKLVREMKALVRTGEKKMKPIMSAFGVKADIAAAPRNVRL